MGTDQSNRNKKSLFSMTVSVGEKKNLIYFYFSLFSLFILSHGWLNDDILITVRTVLNFINGHGPVYNLGERVQVYTHPLWFFILSGLIFLTKEIVYSILLLSAALSIAALWIVSVTHGFNKKLSCFTAFIALLFLCNSFMDYTSSGLESPLGYFLFSLLIFFFYKNVYFPLPIIAAFLFLTRYDYFFIFAPILILYLFQRKSWNKKILSFFISGTLVLSWLIFSLYYYGSLFPNTFFSKTFDFDSIDKTINAINTFKVTFFLDFLTYLPFLVCFPLSLLSHPSLKPKDRVLVFSVLPYFIYVFLVSGDFMMGRFFSIPFFITAPVLVKVCFYFYRNPIVVIKRKSLKVLLFLIVFYPGFLLNYEHLPVSKHIEKITENQEIMISRKELFTRSIISDERGFFFARYFFLPTKRYHLINRAFNEWNQTKNFSLYTVGGDLGVGGLAGGKNSFIVDFIGLTDPYLSKFRAYVDHNKYAARPGHGQRIPPLGYYSTLLTKGKINYICDSELKRKWEQIKEQTRGALSIKKILPSLMTSFKKDDPLPVPDFLNNLNKNRDCKKLKNLYLQKIEKTDLNRNKTYKFTDSSLIRKESADFRFMGSSDFANGEFGLSSNVILDLSARIKWGTVLNKKCFEIVLDGYNEFHVDFYKNGKFFERIDTGKIQSKPLEKNNIKPLFGWKIYKACFEEPLVTENLTIKINCSPKFQRFCFIHSVRFLN